MYSEICIAVFSELLFKFVNVLTNIALILV
jgi:hypothetical protein